MDYAQRIRKEELTLKKLKETYQKIIINLPVIPLETKDYYESQIKNLEDSILYNKVFLQIEEDEKIQAAKEEDEKKKKVEIEKSSGSIKSLNKSSKNNFGGYRRHKQTRNKKRGSKRKSQKRFYR